MVHFKACPQCNGDMYVNSDIYGEYKECLQCGLMLDVQEQDELVQAVIADANDRKKVA